MYLIFRKFKICSGFIWEFIFLCGLTDLKTEKQKSRPQSDRNVIKLAGLRNEAPKHCQMGSLTQYQTDRPTD